MGQIFNLSSILSEALTERIKQKAIKADQLQAEEERKAEEVRFRFSETVLSHIPVLHHRPKQLGRVVLQ